MTTNQVVWDRNMTEKGLTTGASPPCRQVECIGQRLYVKWPDGSITAPCTKGMYRSEKGEWVIL